LEDVVAIKARSKNGKAVAFLTWGRLFDRIDDIELLRVVKFHSGKYAGAPMTQFRLCDSLLEVADHQYFYEALLSFSRQPIPYGKRYESWKGTQAN
jgi:hypothetical protein